MRRSNLGMGSVQRSGAKSRNTDSTPSNRQSMGQQARKSFMAKGLRPDSAKIVGSRLKPLSSEGLNRLSLASLRFTPNRNSGPSSNILQAPASASSKMSTDTARSTGMGTVSRKETRPINDPAFKNQCIDKILDFLVQHGYEHQVNRRSLHTPSTKDFGNIFSFVYRHLDSSYVHPSRFEEEIPKLLKLLKYPVQMSKSSFITGDFLLFLSYY
ncbi:kinetochore protein NDC80 homolog [Cherax quadricarinatus]